MVFGQMDLAFGPELDKNVGDRGEGGMSSSGEWTTRVQSPSTLFTSQQNLLTDNWFNPPRPFSGNKLHKHLPPVTRSVGYTEYTNIGDQKYINIICGLGKIQTRSRAENDYDKDSCNVDILAYLLVTPHMLTSGSPPELPRCSQSRIIITTPWLILTSFRFYFR